MEEPLLSGHKSDEQTSWTRVHDASNKTIKSRYFYASIVYVFYALPMYFYVDKSTIETSEINRIYLGFGVVHLIDAIMYAWAWDEKKW